MSISVHLVSILEHSFHISPGAPCPDLPAIIQRFCPTFSTLPDFRAIYLDNSDFKQSGDMKIRPEEGWEWTQPAIALDSESLFQSAKLEGPGGVYFHIGSNCLAVGYRFLHWVQFIEDLEIQIAAISFCRELLVAVGGNLCIYLPDSAFPPSNALDYIVSDTIEQITERLQQECGEPAARLEHILQVTPVLDENGRVHHTIYDADGYFIERLDPSEGQAV